MAINQEQTRLKETYSKNKKWLKWGPYLSERQWGTVREDYSENGDAWNYLPHDHARSRAYRWGEDGIAGISDDKQRICFAIAVWNGKDPILKERLFGLTGPEGNHGEDVKELYYYLDNVPSHAYMKHLYKYPQTAFPYNELVQNNGSLSKHADEYELLDTGVFDEGKYFDVFTEYAKATEEDLLIRISIYNRGKDAAPIWVMPTLWFRNLWDFGLMDEKPEMHLVDGKKGNAYVQIRHPETGNYRLYFEPAQQHLFTENETNREKIFREANENPFVKDAFHTAITEDQLEILEGRTSGTKFAPLYQTEIPGEGKLELRLRLVREDLEVKAPLGKNFEKVFEQRLEEADAFYRGIYRGENPDVANIQRQAFAGMLWTKQYYHIDMPRWLHGDPGQQSPPASRLKGRNKDWITLNNEDIISMPDKWEYPWYASWDLAFHCLPLAKLDAEFAKNQLILFLREWYMHPNGQIPAYEWSFSDVNPPVHAWACLEVYKIDKAKTGKGDTTFLKRVFQKLLLNFTWWVNRKDHNENNIFEGGFLGLDNIGVFDRSSFIPGGGFLEQADGTAWMAMYCLNMLEMALILGEEEIAYEDVATKFFEHFVYIADSLNQLGTGGSWDEEEGFFYDVLVLPDDRHIPLKVRSLVGLSTLFATLIIKKEQLERLPDFKGRFQWFKQYREANKAQLVIEEFNEGEDVLLSLVPKARLEKLLKALLDEKEFLSPGGIRSTSKIHKTPYVVNIDGQEFGLRYEPAESRTNLFGGNSNWRGPVWFPMNYLLIQSLRTYHQYYQQELTVRCPSGRDEHIDLKALADDLSKRLISIFELDGEGKRPVNGGASIYQDDPNFRDLILFFEYFHGDTARGVGASHQTGWTGLVASLVVELQDGNK